jgi:predicted GTPase
MGYSGQQVKDLEATIRKTDCDTVIIGTPMDLSRVIQIDKPYTRVHYELEELEGLNLDKAMDDFVRKMNLDNRLSCQKRCYCDNQGRSQTA